MKPWPGANGVTRCEATLILTLTLTLTPTLTLTQARGQARACCAASSGPWRSLPGPTAEPCILMEGGSGSSGDAAPEALRLALCGDHPYTPCRAGSGG